MYEVYFELKMFSRLLILVIAFMNLNIGFSSGEFEYNFERMEFNRGGYTQILSNCFASQSDISLPEKFERMKRFQKVIKKFQKEPHINEFDKCGMAPIHYLSITRIDFEPDYVAMKGLGKLLIEIGADLNLPNAYGISPLKLAVNYGNYALVEVFLESGKLKKDSEIFKSIFSSETDSEWFVYREGAIYGKVKIWDSLRAAWFSTSFPDEELDIIYFRMNELMKWIDSSAENQFVQKAKLVAIKTHMETIHETLAKTMSDSSKSNSDGWKFIQETID